MRYTLLVIDMVVDFFERSAVLSAQRSGLVSSINELSRAFRDHNQPVIWVRQQFRPDLKDAFLEMRRSNIQVTIAGTQGCEILPELEHGETDQVIVKKRYSAFFGTNLAGMLASVGTSTLVIGGINSHACIRTTVIDAYQRDHDVIVASDCIGSWDSEHHAITVKYLDGKIARFVENDALIESLSSDVIVG